MPQKICAIMHGYFKRCYAFTDDYHAVNYTIEILTCLLRVINANMFVAQAWQNIWAHASGVNHPADSFVNKFLHHATPQLD